MANETELLVIGAGPGGYAAAFLAADRGLKVTLADAVSRPGGACLHVGCIPSKALLHAAKVITEAREAEAWGVHFAAPRVELDKLRSKKDGIIDKMSGHLAKLAKDRKVEYVQARATFTGPDAVKFDNGQQLRFKHCILATGSSPTRPGAFFGMNSPRILDSTGALELPDVPRSLLVVGGGYIGLEMGTVYAALGSKVTVVELTGSLLPGVDADLVRPLAGRLATQFEKIHLNTKVAKLEDTGSAVQATLEGEEVKEPPVVARSPDHATTGEPEATFDRVLVAVGRRPNSSGLGLEAAGVQLDERGFVRVDERRRSTSEKIFAIGDVAGEPMLAHKAAHEGKVAVEVILGEPAVWEPRAIPAVVFTDPEIAWCGLTETEARTQKREVKVSRFHWAASGRATTLGRSDGVTKLIVDPESDQILGVGLVGPGAGELIAEGVLAIEMAATARDLAMTIHPHPTLTETISEAAEYLHGLATHLYKVRR